MTQTTQPEVQTTQAETTTNADSREAVIAELEAQFKADETQEGGDQQATQDEGTQEAPPPDKKATRRERAAAQLAKRQAKVKAREARIAAERAEIKTAKELRELAKTDKAAALREIGIDSYQDILDEALGKKKEEKPIEQQTAEELKQLKEDLARERREAAELKQAKFFNDHINSMQELCYSEKTPEVDADGKYVGDTGPAGVERWPNVIASRAWKLVAQHQIEYFKDTGKERPLDFALDDVQAALEEEVGRVQIAPKKKSGVAKVPGTGPGQTGRAVTKREEDMTYEERRDLIVRQAGMK